MDPPFIGKRKHSLEGSSLCRSTTAEHPCSRNPPGLSEWDNARLRMGAKGASRMKCGFSGVACALPALLLLGQSLGSGASKFNFRLLTLDLGKNSRRKLNFEAPDPRIQNGRTLHEIRPFAVQRNEERKERSLGAAKQSRFAQPACRVSCCQPIEIESGDADPLVQLLVAAFEEQIDRAVLRSGE